MDITKQIPYNQLNDTIFQRKGVKVFLIRLDALHPVVSGNKLFKLHYFLQKCRESSNPEIITYGGAWSNHLIATAFAAREYGIPVTGIVRGEKPVMLSETLIKCLEYGMKLKFVSRKEYNDLKYDDTCQSATIIPEGGYHPFGAKGAALIVDKLLHLSPTHIITAAGSATTTAGLLIGSKDLSIISVAVMNNYSDMDARMQYLKAYNFINRLSLWNYPFGGFAQYTNELINYMNSFYMKYSIPLDFVYTAKMMYAVSEKIDEGYFPEGSVIACLHTGGLQGNSSIKEQLIY